MAEQTPAPPDGESPPRPKNFALVAAVFEGGLVLVAVFLGWLLGHRPAPMIDWTLEGAAWGLAASLPPMALLLFCVRFPWRPWAEVLEIVDRLLVPLFRDCRLVEIAVISALAGLGEEMLFRGVLQEAVAGWVGEPAGVWIGLAVASILFGLAHLITPAYGLLAGLIGLYLGWLWIATGNLLVPITAHAAYDFLALVYLVRIRRGGSLRSQVRQQHREPDQREADYEADDEADDVH
jgi:membrane protease YdiL (CAAX protease family)